MNISPVISRTVFCGYCCLCKQLWFRAAASVILAIAFVSPQPASATAVRMEISLGDRTTILGNIDIELFDDDAPKTVANFLRYVIRGDYNNIAIHRSVPGFVIQGGGYTFHPRIGIFHIPTDPPVLNEFSPLHSNSRGTIAMAKGNDPDSATSEWFINLVDNGNRDPYWLDSTNGGYTVFGRVSDPGMAVVDTIASLEVSNQSSAFFAFEELPVSGYDGVTLKQENLVVVNRIPNISSTQTGLGTTLTFIADVDMQFYPGWTLDLADAEFILARFSPPPDQTVHFNNGIHVMRMVGVMGSGTRTVTLYDGAAKRPNRYYAYGITPDNRTPHWYDFSYNGETGAEIKNDRIILHFVDGKRGDDNLDLTDDITHIGAQAVLTPTASTQTGGCSMTAGPSRASRSGDWALLAVFLIALGIARKQKRRV